MNNSMKRVQQGFTLIELMIVVAIIGILAAVAIPQYKNYTIKAKLGNATTAADALKTAVALCIQETGSLTGCSGNANGIPANVTGGVTKEVSALSTTDGIISATLATGIDSTTVDGKKICWGANTGANAVTWGIATTVTGDLVTTITKNSQGTAPACT